MNKKLVAVAVAAGLALPMVSAHAVDVADKKLEVYGKVHVAVQSNDDALNTANDNWQVNSIDSRLGFKGAIPLNGGLT
ncbi:MAG: porin, partial [Gammaproteobacteria bacterium]|nr:porin [Gammaproteobacteria bacterium]